MCASSFVLFPLKQPNLTPGLYIILPHANHENVVLVRPFLRRYYDNRPPSAVAS